VWQRCAGPATAACQASRARSWPRSPPRPGGSSSATAARTATSSKTCTPTLGEGPRVDAFTTGIPVAAADLVQAHATWPRFAARALACGIRAVFAFPVQLGTVPIGVLSAYRASAGPLSAADHDRVDRYAHTATVLLRAAAHVNDAGQASMPLPENAGEVQQAVGVVMEHATVDATTALHRLRAYAHHSRRPMRDVVAEVRADHLPFNPTTPT